MVKVINIACPHCNSSSKIYLSVDPKVIILNCPECKNPIVIDEKCNIKSSLGNNSQIINFQMKSKNSTFENSTTSHENLFVSKANENRQIATYKKSYITKSDIYELKIKLSIMCDVTDFINSI